MGQTEVPICTDIDSDFVLHIIYHFTMKKNVYLLSLATSALLLSACSQKMGELKSEYFNTTPQPLTAVAGKVSANVTATLPAKVVPKNAYVTVRPQLRYQTGQSESQPTIFTGEKIRDNYSTVSWNEGGSVVIPVLFDYTPDAAKSDLFLDFEVRQGSKTYTVPAVLVGTGVNATSTLAQAGNVSPAVAPDAFKKVIQERYTADINFLINQTNLRSGELTKDEVKDFHAAIAQAQNDDKRKVADVNIQSYASPEGGVDLNTRIASGREENTQKYLSKELQKQGVDASLLTADFTAQDWEGFQELVQKSNIPDKELILSVLSMYKDPEQREREIRNMSSVFTQLAQDVLPKLRRSRLTAAIDVIGKTEEQMKQEYLSTPEKLTADELLYYASTLPTNADRMAAYRQATKLFPNDYRSYNNLGVTQLVSKQYDAAEGSFNKALQLNSQSKEAQMNLGVIALQNGNFDKAQLHLGNAAGQAGLEEAMGAMYLLKGDYTSAARSLANVKSNNAALAQILTADYNSARNTLSAITNPDADTYYLMAILGARTHNEQMVLTNLSKAVKLDSSKATRARTDIEFKNINLTSVL